MKLDEIVFKHLNGELSPQESEKFMEWMESDPENRQRVEELEEIWDKTKNYPRNFAPNTAIALERVSKIARIEIRRHILNRGMILRVAAVALLILGLAGVLRYTFYHSAGEELLVVTGNNEVKEIVLPDSTHVWLNAGSELRYPDRFARKERNVSLSGEAYFEVHRNTQSPFLVNLSGSYVKVLGTRFNIHAYRGDSSTTVSVTHGKVQYAATGEKQLLILTAGDIGILDNHTLSLHKEKVTDQNFLAWKTHILEFRNTPLIEVIKTLSTRFKVPYTTVSESNSNIAIYALYNNKTLVDILNSLSAVTGRSIRLQNDTIVIK
ncbi:MAG TPA: FecR domain-containing protein [Bacteroidales bacterium]|nr:FecR domain-containing protein [Bacteroidales bacterium]